MAFYGFVGNGDAIIFGFIIAGKYPDFAFVPYAYLRTANDMSGGMQAEFDVVDYKRLTPFFTGNVDVSQPVPDDGDIGMMGDVGLVSPTAVICMTV